jgi:Ca2+-transporting ATPase
MVYMNTNVTRGAGEFVVTATAMATEVGHISGMLAEEQAVKTPLTRQMDRLTGQILVIAGIALIASMALNLARGETFIAVFNAAVAFAIAAIPVGLPTVVTTILAWGTQQLARAGAIMKRLASTQRSGPPPRSTRQDRHADAEPDDRGPDDGGRPPVCGRRAALLDRRADHPGRRAGGHPAG